MYSAMCILVLALGENGDGRPSADELCQHVLKRRAAIDKAEFDLMLTPPQAHEDTNGGRIDFHIYIQGENRRFDKRTFGRRPSLLHGRHRTIVSNDGVSLETMIASNGRYIVFSPNVYSDGSRRAVEIGTVDDESGRLDDMFDPRMLGILPLPFGLYSRYQLDFHFGGADHNLLSIERDEVNNVDSWRCEWQRSDGLLYRYWFAIQQDFSVVRAETESRFHEQTVLDRLETINSRCDDPLGWFPQSIVFTRLLDDRQVMRESMLIDNVKADIPEEASVFAMSSLGVTPGTSVYQRTAEGHVTDQIWDGKVVRKMEADELKRLPENVPGTDEKLEKRKSSFLMLISINSAVVAVLLLIVYLCRRRTGMRGHVSATTASEREISQ